MSITPVTTAVAPVVGQVGHKAKHGGHYLAYKAQAAFAGSDTLAIVAGTNNPWRPGTPGHAFYSAVLSQAPATVADAIALGAKAGFKASAVQGHLRWLFTWGGAYLAVNGLLYGGTVAPAAPAPAAPAPAAPASVLIPAKGKKGKVAA